MAKPMSLKLSQTVHWTKFHRSAISTNRYMLLAERLRSEEEKTAMRLVLEEQVPTFWMGCVCRSPAAPTATAAGVYPRSHSSLAHSHPEGTRVLSCVVASIFVFRARHEMKYLYYPYPFPEILKILERCLELLLASPPLKPATAARSLSFGLPTSTSARPSRDRALLLELGWA